VTIAQRWFLKKGGVAVKKKGWGIRGTLIKPTETLD
jgi:hypothetical protein